ncbi:DEKNAAC104933 [Brettanomyces naardenensis]|uniref:D-xylose 1-dehydrogenase (NADP(+), D-xylono-1,5-lactone-forming) n=1 Tax=Brettanomyces naardenensis TaxID=13370 RepID=A0A448YRX4_BRENA|nr:DEKNAAC104933 [Brettanomyces naardenensis]
MSFELNWGVIGPGRIASTFINDLLHSHDTLRKDVTSKKIRHKLVAIASSSSVERARKFKEDSINEASDDGIKCYGSYNEIFNDPKVDILYIATPNLNHYQLCFDALSHGKNVLMEKPFTINYKQAEILAKLAKDKHLFLMEAYWTKFLPVYREVYDLLFSHDKSPIGEIKRVVSDLSFTFPRDDPGMERIYDPSLGGGVTLDIGIYSMYWPLGFLDKDCQLTFPDIAASANMADTGVDISTAVILKYNENNTLGIATCSGFFDNHSHGVVINGTKGRIEVDDSCVPSEYWVYDEKNEPLIHKRFNYNGRGMFFEADHVADCLARGLKESPLHTLSHTIRMAKILDTVRKQVGTIYPESLESTETSKTK